VETEPYIKDSSKRIGITVFMNKEEIPSPYYPTEVEVKTTQTSIGGEEAQEDILIRLTDKNQNRQSKWILIEKNGRFYWLVASLEDPKTVEVFNQILNTFEFVE
jgi:hypothetical protein